MRPRSILITGANGGLGAAIAEAFLQESPANRVWMGVRARRENAERLAGQYEARCRTVQLDVTDPAAWKQAISRILEADGRLDVLVNNAGGHEDGLLAQMPVEQWNRVLGVNLNSTFHGCQAVLPAMIAQKHGRIINVSSVSALLAPAGQANYAAAKAGVIALTQSLAKEVARIGITVNAVCPGFIETDALSGMDQAARQSATQKIAMRRFGKPAEAAAAVVFLACEAASYITGSQLKIDGGVF